MRKTALAMLIAVVCVFFSGCSVYNPSQTLYCTAMGVDQDDEGVSVSVTVRDSVYTETAENIAIALRMLGSRLGGELFYKTVRVYVISSGLDAYTVNSFYDFALRERETMVKSRIVSAGECTSAEVLKAFTEEGELEDSLIADSFRDNSLLEVLSRVSGGREPVLLRCVSVSESDGESRVSSNGISVYRSSGEFAGYARGMVETGILAVRGYAEGSAVSAGGYGVRIDSSRCGMEYSDGVITVSLDGDFTLIEAAPDAEPDAGEAVSGYIRDCVLEAIRFSDKLGDICGTDDYMYRHHSGEQADRTDVTADFTTSGSGLKK